MMYALTARIVRVAQGVRHLARHSRATLRDRVAAVGDDVDVTEPDPAFADPRLAHLYDVFEDDRDDLELYAAWAVELGARSVVDVGCGTGELAVRLVRRGFEVVGVDPAVASLDVARRKDGSEHVRWVEGDASRLAVELPDLAADLAVMTGNVAQVFVRDDEWRATLAAIRGALRSGGHLVFETRRPEVRAWEAWVGELTTERAEIDDGSGARTAVETRFDLLDVVEHPLTVSFRWTYVFDPDGPAPEIVISDSTLRFRDRDEIEHDLSGVGFDLVEVRDAPDRPGREWVFVARAR
jgi:SAM-dependent methyltransferase